MFMVFNPGLVQGDRTGSAIFIPIVKPKRRAITALITGRFFFIPCGSYELGGRATNCRGEVYAGWNRHQDVPVASVEALERDRCEQKFGFQLMREQTEKRKSCCPGWRPQHADKWRIRPTTALVSAFERRGQGRGGEVGGARYIEKP